MISESRHELINIVEDFGAGRASRMTSRASTLRPSSRATSRAASPEKITIKPARKENDPILRKLEDIDPYLLLHSTPEQLAKELGMRKTKEVGDINEEIEIIRSESRMGGGSRNASRASDKEEKEVRKAKVGAFTDVTRQIDNMKTDHIRTKIFARHESAELSDSGSNSSIKKSPQDLRKKSILRKTKPRSSVDLEDEISPNAKKFNKDVGLENEDFSDEEEKLEKARKGGKRCKNKIVISDDEDFDVPKSKPVRKIGGKTLSERQNEDPLDLTKTRHRLLMPDPSDPLDPANIEKMLEARMKARRASEAGDSDDARSNVSTSSKASRTGEDWLAMAARAAEMSAELSALDAEPIDNEKFDRVYNDVLEKKKSTTPESDEDDLSDEDEFEAPPKRQSKESNNSASENAPKFRSRFLDKVRGSISEKPDQRKIAEDYIKGRTSRQSSEGSSNRGNSRVSFTEPVRASSRSRKERTRAPSGQSTFTMDPDGDDVSLARFGVRCETNTPISGSRQKTRQRSGDSTISTSSNRKSDKVKDIMAGYLRS
ncbi:unnamed protein product [Oikopleura dioica]|uniref:Uncharacterized protein n=1 Tax=Oikopleura dioica TaxID=34765 RepID=E4YGK9_OIKDI|nr:unnamed protein product [Oikopleura dioica]